MFDHTGYLIGLPDGADRPRTTIIEDRRRAAKAANEEYCAVKGLAGVRAPDLSALATFDRDGEPGRNNRFEVDIVTLSSIHNPPVNLVHGGAVRVVVPFAGADEPEFRRWSVGMGFLSFMLNAPPGAAYHAVAFGPECVVVSRDRRPGRPEMTLDLGSGYYRPGVRTRIGKAGPPEQWRWLFESASLFEEIAVMCEIPQAPDECGHSRLRVCGGGIDAWTGALIEWGAYRCRMDGPEEYGFRLFRGSDDFVSGWERARAATLAQKWKGASR